MTRRGRRPLAAVSCLLLLLLVSCAREEARDVRPSIVIVSLDTLRPDHLSGYGHTVPTSPRLDAFAAEAVCFTNARCQSGGTLTSHLSLLTSLYPPQFGITRNDGRNVRQLTTSLCLSDRVRTLAEILRAEGYETAAFTGGGFVAARYGFDRGFDRFDADSHFGGLEESLPTLASHLAERAADSDRSSRPLFLFVHTYAIHQPYDTPGPFSGYSYSEMGELLGHAAVPKLLTLNRDRLSATGLATVRALYDNGILATDRRVGDLFALLKRHGLYEEAIVVVLSDHGEEFLEHGGFGHGRTVYDEMMRVPLILRMPEAREAGRLVDGPVALLDVAPTVLELAGLEIPGQFEGRSLAGLAQGSDDGAWLSDRGLLLDIPNLVPGERALLAGRWKLIRGGAPIRTELYDVRSDPGETRSVIRAQSELGLRMAKELTARYADLREASREKGWAAVPQQSEGLPEPALEQLRALGYVD